MKFLCALCLLCVLAGPLHALDRHAFAFTRYDLNARIEPEQQRLAVRGKITLRNDSGMPQKNLSLQISSTLNWVSIQFEGKPVEFISQPYTSDIDHTGALTEAIVVLPRPVAPKQSIELELGYEGIIPQDATRLTRIGTPPNAAKHSDWDQISRTFTAVRGIGYVAWYPISTEAVSLSDGNAVAKEVGRWKQRERDAQMKISFTYSRPETQLTLLCNGTMGSPKAADAAEPHEPVCSLDPIANSTPVFVIAQLENLDKPAVNISYLAPHKSGADDYALAVDQVTPSITSWFGDHRGTANAKAVVADLPDANDSPFESGTMLLMPLTSDETTMLLSALRQLTHLYFPSPREWIGEGLAGYAQANYFLAEKGRETALAYLQSHRSALVQSEQENLARNNDGSGESSLIHSPDELYVEAKAMNVWWMLRDMVGNTAFTAALHNYNPHDDSGDGYMQKLIELQSHRDLKWFFDDWVYSDRGLPDFRIAEVYPRQIEQGSFLVTVTIENLGGAGAEVPVTAHMAEGDTTQRLIVPGKSKASIRIVAPALPNEITVNDGNVPESGTTTHVYKMGAKQ